MSKISQSEIERLDAQIMPFGMHKGKPMSKVPAQYLDWLRGQETTHPMVTEYLEKMGDYIDAELDK